MHSFQLNQTTPIVSGIFRFLGNGPNKKIYFYAKGSLTRKALIGYGFT